MRLAPLMLLGASALANPCGGMSLRDGTVEVGVELVAARPLPEEVAGCVRALGAALAERRARGITISVRGADKPLEVGAAYTEALVAGGFSAPRISVVAPAAAGEPAGVRLAFADGRAARSVAEVLDASGEVTAGTDPERMRPVTRGDVLEPGSHVRTGEAGLALIALADGSRVRMSPSSWLFVRRLNLDSKMRRTVRIELRGGELEPTVAPSSGRFEIETRNGTAGVRGTEFRLVESAEATRLETLGGSVALENTHGQVLVGAGQGSRVRAGGAPEPPRRLPAAPAVVGPLRGPLPADRTLRWGGVPEATTYRVELARDAEFLHDWRALPAAGTSLQVTADGRWCWRVVAIDAEGFVGAPSKVYAFGG